MTRQAETSVTDGGLADGRITTRVADPRVLRVLGISRGGRARRLGWRVAKWLLLAVVVLGVGGAIVRGRRPAPPAALVTAPVAKGDLRVTVEATGTVDALTTVEVGAEVSGRLLRLAADYNDHVTRGQVLAEIDPEQLQAAAEQASAQLVAAEAAVRQARATAVEQDQAVVRTRALAGQQMLAPQALEGAEATALRARAALDNARANANLAQAALVSARSHRQKATIRAPIDGIVLARLVEPGQTVTAGFTTPVLFRLAEDLTHMSLRVNVDEADVGRVRDGQVATFTVDAYPEQTFSSRVVSLRNDPKTAQNVVSYEAVLSVDNRDLLLKPGMTATATILTSERRGVLLVPNAALRFVPPGATPAPPRPGWKTVWVVPPHRAGEPPTPAVEVAVRAGATDGSSTELLEGALFAGAEVALDVQEGP